MPNDANAITLKSLRVKGLLSFGLDGATLDLRSLNILIGPNASGKSNLIETVGLLQTIPTDVQEGLRAGGGVGDWLWRGAMRPIAEVEAVVAYPDGIMPLRYVLSFTEKAAALDIVEERLENESPFKGNNEPFRFFHVHYGHGAVSPRTGRNDKPGGERPATRRLQPDALDLNQSVLAQRRDPDVYPEITYAANLLKSFRLYREWSFGRYTPPRVPQPTDLPSAFLLSDASNLALVLNNLKKTGAIGSVRDNLRQLYDLILEIETIVDGGRVQTYMIERGLESPVPATRLSDGTLRLLCLLAILCHPDPPPVICIEEPEIGLHPDVLPVLARLLMSASERTQLIVTTHSEGLVDLFTETPDAVVVCERQEHGTVFQRLDAEALRGWLEDYRLGKLWRKGVLGGNRW